MRGSRRSLKSGRSIKSRKLNPLRGESGAFGVQYLRMVIKGFQRVSLLDFPGKISAVVFIPGCNFRCPFCYNRDLVLNPGRLKTVPEADIFSYLQKRRSVLDGVVVTGGEPLLQEGLPQFLKKVKEMGFLVKLDTNGSRTEVLRSVVKRGLVDFVAVDVKAPLDERYACAVGGGCDVEAVCESTRVLTQGGIDFELRTTVVPTLHKKEDLVDLATQISSLTPHPTSLKWCLQQFQPKSCLDRTFEAVNPYSRAELEEILMAVKKHVPSVRLRGV